MNLHEYLTATKRRAMTSIEAQAFGLRFNELTAGWMRGFADLEMTEHGKVALLSSACKSGRRARKVFGVAIAPEQTNTAKQIALPPALTKSERRRNAKKLQQQKKLLTLSTDRFGLQSWSRPNKPMPVLQKAARVDAFIKNSQIDPRNDEFLRSFEWRALRMKALELHGPVCQCCGASPRTGAVINVDHIKPRRDFPHLALTLDNLQILCNDCNAGKGSWSETDWRTAQYSDQASDQAQNAAMLEMLA